MAIGWRYYQFALLPTTAPHEPACIKDLESKDIWRISRDRRPLFARWTEDFDCGFETEWWYCILDKPFDLESVNSKKRYEIKKGIQNYSVDRINPADFAVRMADIMEESYRDYPKSYRPRIEKDIWVKKFRIHKEDESRDYWGIFSRETGNMDGFAVCLLHEDFVDLGMVKVLPSEMGKGGNAALVLALAREYVNSGKFRYMCDGERNIVHRTNYQDYLIKYFNFRKAYCILRMRYRFLSRVAIVALRPLLPMMRKVGFNNPLDKVRSVLEMDRISIACARLRKRHARSL